MTIDEHLEYFADLPVQLFVPGSSLSASSEAAPSAYAWRIGKPFNYEDTEGSVTNGLNHLLKDPDAKEVQAIVLGAWASWEGDETSDSIMELLLEGRDRLTGLKHLHFADIVMEESEISWIEHTNLAQLLAAYPNLETLVVRGSGATLGISGHPRLEKLRIESGGTDPAAVKDIGAGSWPKLEHLEIWLGTEDYGGGAGKEHVRGILEGKGLPALKRLGLMNSDQEDDIVEAVVDAQIVRQLSALDLSMGVLGNRGADALLSAPELFAHLEELNLRWNFIDEERSDQLRQWKNVIGIDEKGDDFGGPDEDDRYTEVAE